MISSQVKSSRLPASMAIIELSKAKGRATCLLVHATAWAPEWKKNIRRWSEGTRTNSLSDYSLKSSNSCSQLSFLLRLPASRNELFSVLGQYKKDFNDDANLWLYIERNVPLYLTRHKPHSSSTAASKLNTQSTVLSVKKSDTRRSSADVTWRSFAFLICECWVPLGSLITENK